jgi:ATP-dependent DNA helicase RecG
MNRKAEKLDWNELVQRESARVEWKENVANLQNVVKTLSAFANDFQQVGGGRVLCGLKEEKNQYGEPVAKVVGLDEKRFKEVKNKVMAYCHQCVEPPLTPVVSEYPLEHDPSRRILVFAVTSSQYAHRYRTSKNDVNYYIRINDETRPADGLIPQLLERKTIWPPYLDQTHPEATLDAIDLMAVKEFLGGLKLPHPFEKYLEPNIQFRGDVRDLVTHPPGRTDQAVPRNFTILLFGGEPHRFFRGAYAIFSVYAGKDKTSNHSQRFEVFGPIPGLIRNLMDRLQLYMGIDIDKTQDVLKGNQNRRRFSEYAVQEAIVNAFVHRDYHSYDPVRVTVFEDRIEVTSPGGPNVPMDAEKIKEGKIFTSWRNPSLAWFMVELEFAQNEGKGIKMIIEHTRGISGKDPQFTITPHWFHIEIPAFIPLLEALPEEKKEPDIDIKTGLISLQDNFDQLKDLLSEKDPGLERKLREIGNSLDAIHPGSPKNEYIGALTKLRRFLMKLNDEKSRYYELLSLVDNGIAYARELEKTYNQFAQWLTLPQIPGIEPKEKKGR